MAEQQTRTVDTVAIVTGASRGLGAALARALLDAGASVLTLARHRDEALTSYARARGASLWQGEADLADPATAAQVAQTVCAQLPAGARRYWLINNAGSLAPIARADALGVDEAGAAQISAAFNVNVLAPMLLTARFLTATQSLAHGPAVQRRVLNISSGAGRNPHTGWSVYCATKAALDRATQVAALEQAATGVAPAQLVSLAPGIVDTDMQASIRASDPAHFPTRAQFQAFHDEGKLSAPDEVARRILRFLRRDDYGSQVLADIRTIEQS